MSILPDIFYNYFIGTNSIKKKDSKKFYYVSLIKEPNNKWSIHGLWPQYSKNSYPTFCKKVKFDINKLESILPELNEKWYSNEEKNEDFWKHEWEKHGSCMFLDMNEEEYFKKTLDLFTIAQQIDLPNDFYDSKTKKCLIPIDLGFNFDL